MDVHCSTCNEPWDVYHLWHDAIFETGLSVEEAQEWCSLPRVKKLSEPYRKEFKAAADYWQRMLPLVPPDSEDARTVRENVEEARKLAGAGPVAKHPGLRGTVRLSPKFKEKFAPGDTVFIYARAAEGPAMPLAVLRRSARELPVDFALDDSLAMAPGMAISAHPRVVISARVSRSGNAKPEPGDLQGASKPVANDAKGVVVEINEVVR